MERNRTTIEPLFTRVREEINQASYARHGCAFNIQEGMLTHRGHIGLDWYLLSPNGDWWHKQKIIQYCIAAMRWEVTLTDFNACGALNKRVQRYVCMLVDVE